MKIWSYKMLNTTLVNKTSIPLHQCVLPGAPSLRWPPCLRVLGFCLLLRLLLDHFPRPSLQLLVNAFLDWNWDTGEQSGEPL